MTKPANKQANEQAIKEIPVSIDREMLLTNLVKGFRGYKSALKIVTEYVDQTTLYFKELGIKSADVAVFATENQANRVVSGSRLELIKKFRADFIERIQSPDITQPTALDYWSKLLKGVKAGYGIQPAKKVKTDPIPETKTETETETGKGKGYSLERCAGVCNQLIIWLQSQENLTINVISTVKVLQEAIRLMGVTIIKE